MSGVKTVVLRVVGGNDKLVAMRRVRRQSRWPPLRVVEPHATLPQVSTPCEQRVAAKRPTWTLMWMVGLLMVMMHSIGQAIADY